MSDLPFLLPEPDPTRPERATRRCLHPRRQRIRDAAGNVSCGGCSRAIDAGVARRGKNNRKRGGAAELAVAKLIPGSRKMGPLGLPWDVEVGTYARLQVKKLIHPPSPAAIARLIRAIPDTGDRLRGFVWVEAAGQGKRGKRVVWFLSAEFERWRGADFGPGNVSLVTMPLAEWVAEFVQPADRAAARLP